MEGIIKTMFPPYPKPGFTPDFTGYYYDKLGINWHAVYANVSQQPDEALVMVWQQYTDVRDDRQTEKLHIMTVATFG